MLHTFLLPQTELRVSAICYGAASFGTAVQGEAMDRLFGMLRDAGGNFFDTAHCYCAWLPDGDGVSERALGECVRRQGGREALVIASKGGHPAMSPYYPRPERFLAPEVITADIDDSLRRLRMDVIDLYYLHRDDAAVPVGEIVESLNAEVARGRIRYLGASNWRVERIAEANAYAAAHGLRGFVISQPQFSLAQPAGAMGDDPCMRHLTTADMRWHTTTQLPVAAYTSTAGGFFAGRAGGFDTPDNRARRERAEQLASSLNATPTQVALAWLLAQPFPVIPILGTTQPDHLREGLAATEVRLTEEQVNWLR